MSEENIDATHWLPLNDKGVVEVLTEAREARGDVSKIEGDRGGEEYRSFSFPLDYLLNRGLISDEQYESGNRFHRLWYYSFSAQYRQMRFGLVPSGASDLESTRLLAIQYVEALRAIRGEDERNVAHDVCCRGVTVSRLPGYSSKSSARQKGMPLLLAALDDLERHFRRR